ncbi:50S ribosomal protein L9 [soil metagenome]
MKVILRQDHDTLGDAGHILEVKDGYARNFLIPRGIASIASDSNKKSVEEVKRQKGKKMLKLIDDAKKLASELEKHTIEITVKTGEDNKMFGSVTTQMIEEGLEKIGFAAVDKRKLTIKEPIKALGEHRAEIKLAQGVVANLKLKVVSDTITENGSEFKEESESQETPNEAVESTIAHEENS